MANVFINDGGTYRTAKEIFVNDNGTWRTIKQVSVNDNGTWRQVFPESSGTQAYTTAGSYSFVVPNGVYSLTATIVGGGGGGGGFFGSGDTHAGGGGGSGGYYSNQSVAVTPGETLTLTVGAGGGSASYEFNGSWICIGTVGQSGAYYNGTAGGDTIIYRGATPILTATGGGPGLGAGPGDNMGNSAPGAGGLPNGVAGQAGNPNRNSFCQAQGGSNGTGYGTGGKGNASQCDGPCPTVGGVGYISLSW